MMDHYHCYSEMGLKRVVVVADHSIKLEKKRQMSRLFLRKNFLRVPVLLSDRSGSLCSSFCGFKDDDESKSVDDGSTNSSSFRLFVLLFVCTDCLEENISEN